MKIDREEALTFKDVLIKPQYSEVDSRTEIDITTKFSKNVSLRIPIVSANMDTVTEWKMAAAMANLGGLGIIHRYNTIEEQVKHIQLVKKENSLYQVGAAVGAKGDFLERAKACARAGACVIVLDVAHAHSKMVLSAAKSLKIMMSGSKTDLVVGNVATKSAIVELTDVGVDGIKIGIGPGYACSTRVVTGAGVPQLSAIMDCIDAQYYRNEAYHIPLCADGGIRDSGDIAKAIGAGAHTVMLGSLLAGTDESPGKLIGVEPTLHKVYRGMASAAAAKKNNPELRDDYVPEGIETKVPYRGLVKPIISNLIGGLLSGMSYSGAIDVETFHRRAKFIRITNNGWLESIPNGYKN